MIHRFFKWLTKLHGDSKKVIEVLAEWHCFWIGLAETFCFNIRPHFRPTEAAMKEMKKEWHYYMIGRATGIAIWAIVVISVLIIKIP